MFVFLKKRLNTRTNNNLCTGFWKLWVRPRAPYPPDMRSVYSSSCNLKYSPTIHMCLTEPTCSMENTLRESNIAGRIMKHPQNLGAFPLKQNIFQEAMLVDYHSWNPFFRRCQTFEQLEPSWGSPSQEVNVNIVKHSVRVIDPVKPILVGGFNPFEWYQSNWIISPGRGENRKCLKPPPIVIAIHGNFWAQEKICHSLLFERFHSYRAKTWWNNPNHKIPCLHHNFHQSTNGSLNQSCQRDWSIELVGVFVTTHLYPKKTQRSNLEPNLRLQTVGCETVCCDLAPRWYVGMD